MIGIIGAMSLEIENLKSRLENPVSEEISGASFTRGRLFGREVVLAVCGIGKCFAALCAEAMILRFSPEAVINIGVAGTLTDQLGIGDLAIGTDAVCHDLDTTPLGDPPGFISGIGKVHLPLSKVLAERAEEVCGALGIRSRSGTIASGDTFVVDRAYKAMLSERYGAIACEMEGQAIAQVCYMNQTPCLILRSISDSIDGGASDYETFKYQAAETAGKIVAALLPKI